ncbi:unnamed protein product, partial [Polarella glacialis]
MRYDTGIVNGAKDGTCLWPEEELFRELRAELEGRFQDLQTDVAVSNGSRPVRHISVLGLPRIGGGAHASVADGNVHIAAVVGSEVSFDQPGGSLPLPLVRGGVQAQTYRCCQLIEQVLRGCNASWGDLACLRVHMPNLEDTTLEDFRLAADFFFQERGCPAVATSVVGCSQLWRSAAVQIEGTAVCPESFDQPQRMLPFTEFQGPPGLPLPSGWAAPLSAGGKGETQHPLRLAVATATEVIFILILVVLLLFAVFEVSFILILVVLLLFAVFEVIFILILVVLLLFAVF